MSPGNNDLQASVSQGDTVILSVTRLLLKWFPILVGNLERNDSILFWGEETEAERGRGLPEVVGRAGPDLEG